MPFCPCTGHQRGITFRLLNRGWQTTAHGPNPATVIRFKYHPHYSTITMAKSHSCNRRYVVCKTENIYYRTLCRKSLLVSDLEKFILFPGTPSVLFSGEEKSSFLEEGQNEEKSHWLVGQVGLPQNLRLWGLSRHSLQEEERKGSGMNFQYHPIRHTQNHRNASSQSVGIEGG